MRPLALLVLPLLLLAGCAAPTSDIEAASAHDAAASGGTGPWSVEAEGALGWVAGAGVHAFAGDLIVGVRSHEQCPRASWVVPEGAQKAVIALAAGTGPSKLALGEPKGVTYVDQVDGAAATFEVDAPTPGIWTLELKPVGVAAPQTRALLVTLEGAGARPVLALQPDVDCLL